MMEEKKGTSVYDDNAKADVCRRDEMLIGRTASAPRAVLLLFAGWCYRTSHVAASICMLWLFLCGFKNLEGSSVSLSQRGT